MAYTNQPRTNPRDGVRLLVGDISTSTGSEILSDVDYDFFVSVTPNIYSAACLAANSLSAKVTSLSASTSSVVEKKVGDLMLRMGVSAGNVEAFHRAFSALCARLEKQSAIASAGPFAGGLTVSGKRAVEQDADRVKPWAQRDLFDNPASVGPSASTSNTDGI